MCFVVLASKSIISALEDFSGILNRNSTFILKWKYDFGTITFSLKNSEGITWISALESIYCTNFHNLGRET